MSRDREFEQGFLGAVLAGARQPPGFADRVVARLDAAGARFDRDLPEHLSIREVLGEVREECEDMPGWALMALHLARARGVPVAKLHLMEGRLARGMAFAALADRELGELLAELGEP